MSKHERFEVNALEVFISFGDGGGSVILLEGTASIFGAPLRQNVRYRFISKSVTVVCVGRSRFDVAGYFEAMPPRPLSSSIHELKLKLAQRSREAMLSTDRSGPVVLFVGDKDTGKSTACRHLANLFLTDGALHLPTSSQSARVTNDNGKAALSEHADNKSDSCNVIYADLDVGQNAISCPGTVATVFLEAPVPVDDDFTTMIPLTFFFGDKSVTSLTRKRYLDICSWTMQSVLSVQKAKRAYCNGPVILNTMGWTRDVGYEMIKQLISICSVTDVVVTAGTPPTVLEQLQADFSFARDTLAFHKYDAGINGMALTRSGLDRVRCRSQQLHSYFHGTLRTPLVPSRLVVYLKEVVLLDAITLEVLPLKQLKPLTLAAVSTAPQQDMCGAMNVAGFVIITDIGKQTLTLLSPAPGKLPRPFLLVSTAVTAKTEDIPSMGVA